MTILLPTLAIAFAAFCVWLTVRIVNRRERWAKWTLAATLGVPVLYVASFGPACWIFSRIGGRLPDVYRPFKTSVDKCDPAGRLLIRYARFGMAPNGFVALPQDRDDFNERQVEEIYNATTDLEIGLRSHAAE